VLNVHLHNVKGVFALAVASATTQFVPIELHKERRGVTALKNIAGKVPGGLEVALLGLEAVDGFIEGSWPGWRRRRCLRWPRIPILNLCVANYPASVFAALTLRPGRVRLLLVGTPCHGSFFAYS
jgi:hypothetical protein